MTYWLINLPFLALAVVMAVVASALVARGRRVGLAWQPIGIVLMTVLLMTAVFDNAMIGVGLVGYEPAAISGVYIGIAPIEDFAYPVAAAILLPALWVVLGPRPTPAAPVTVSSDATGEGRRR